MNPTLLSFNNGEVSPYLRHRIDFEKTASSAETFENFIATPYGAASKRPGLLHIAVAADTAGQNSHAFPFVSTSGDRYILHFAEDTLTIYREDGTVADSMAFLTATAPDATTDTTGFWSAPLREIQIEVVNDVLFITHPDTHPLRLSRVSDTNWQKEFIPFTQPPVLDQNSDPLTKLSVFSNPIADSWVTSTSYAVGDVVFQGGAEWQATLAHTSGSTTQPGIGASWKGSWRRKLYAKGDAITLSHINERVIPIVKEVPLHALVQERSPGFGTWLCIAAHTPDSWHERPLSNLASEYGYVSKWVQVRGSTGTLQPPGTYCTNGTITPGTSHVHLNISATSQQNSPQTATSTADWQYIRSYPWDSKRWDDYVFNLPNHDPTNNTGTINLAIVAGQYYSFRGIAYLAKSSFDVAWIQPDVTPYTNTGTSPTTGLPVSWNSGIDTDFTDTTKWEPIGFFEEGHGSSIDSPGSAWKLSPRRDDKDFQISHGALQANDATGSQPIAMQGAWNVNTFGTWHGTFNVQRSADNGLTWETIRSYESNGDRNIADSGTEDVPCLLRLYFIENASTAASGDQRAVLTPETQSISGYVQADTFVNTAVLTGTALTPVMSGLTPDWSEGAFSTVRGFPRTLALHESRLCFASTTYKPVSLWLSQTDDLLNFEQGVEDTDSVFVTLAAPYQYPIRWIESQRRLFIGSAVALWVAGSETSDAALTPSNFNARQYAATGSSSTRPLLAADSLFFTDRKGSRLYQVSFSAELEGYEPADLSRLAEHITQPGIAQMAWQQTREPSLWAITRAGNLLQFCYSRRDNLMAWSRHNSTGALFRNVVILPSDDGDDDVFFILDRNGVTTLERFPQNYQQTQETGQIPGLTANPLFPYHYLDGITYSGAATTSLTVPAHLFGQALTLLTVSAGGVVTSSTVTPTASPLTIASTTRAILGKAVTSRLSSLPVDFPGNQSLTKRLHKIALSLFRSKGGTMYNAASASAKPIPYPSTALFTGWAEMLPDLGNLNEVQVHIVHADPYPFTVRAVGLRMNQTER